MPTFTITRKSFKDIYYEVSGASRPLYVWTGGSRVQGSADKDAPILAQQRDESLLKAVFGKKTTYLDAEGEVIAELTIPRTGRKPRLVVGDQRYKGKAGAILSSTCTFKDATKQKVLKIVPTSGLLTTTITVESMGAIDELLVVMISVRLYDSYYAG